MDVRNAVRMLFVEADRLSAAVYMMACVKAEINGCIRKKTFNFFFCLYMTIDMRVEYSPQAIRCDMICAALNIFAVGVPFLIRELTWHDINAGFQISIHRRKEYDIFCLRKLPEKRCNIINCCKNIFN